LQLQRLADYSKSQRDYWWRRIDSLPEAIKLPKKDNLPSFARSPGFEVRRTGIPANEWEQISKSITSRGLQVSTALSVLFAEVIAMYTGTDHLCINIMGNFNSTLLLEFDFRNEEESLETRIRRTQKLFLQDLENSTLVTATEVISELNSRRGSLMEPYR
jgi:pyochelin synthetase